MGLSVTTGCDAQGSDPTYDSSHQAMEASAITAQSALDPADPWTVSSVLSPPSFKKSGKGTSLMVQW